MTPDQVAAMVQKVLVSVAAIGIALIGWSLRTLLADLRSELAALRQVTAGHGESLAKGQEKFRTLERRVDGLEERERGRCRECRIDALPNHTPSPGRP